MTKYIITASIVTYKSNLHELSIVLKCTADSSVEKIYIVDNSPTDELKTFATVSPKIEYLFGHGNIGYGSAHNIAMRKAIELGAKYHVVINPDISFNRLVIENLAQYMDHNEDIGHLMPKIIYPDGEIQYLCKLLPTPMDLIGRRFIPVKSYIARRNYHLEMRGSGYDKIINVPFLSGCFMFLRVDAIAKVDGFDDDFFMYCEDIDLCRRIGMAGFRTVYYPKESVIHTHAKESFKSKVMLKAHIKSALRYFNKWGWLFDDYRSKTNSIARKQY